MEDIGELVRPVAGIDVADVKLTGVVVKVADVKVSGLRSLVVVLCSLVGYRYLSCMFWHLCAMETIIHSS